MGRRKGSRNGRPWFRAGRGWFATEGTRSIPLVDDTGQRIRDRSAKQEAEAAYHRYKASKQPAPEPAPDPEPELSEYTVRDVCLLYLQEAKKNSSPATYELRHRLLHDLCEGGSPKGRKVHEGYGDLPIHELIGLHIKKWLDAHENWNGTRRTAVQAIRRAIFYCKELGVVKKNPLAGFKAGVAGKRQAYFSEKEEAAIDKHASRALGEAIRVMIETGVRPGELAHLEARHVEKTEQGQAWRFPPDEHKTGWKTKKDRVVPVSPEIAAIIRRKIREYPKGKLFRNSSGNPWTPGNFRAAFARLRKKLEKEGIELDKNKTLYACRHTYAKRMLAKGVTMENLAAKLSNTTQVCYAHYGEGRDRQKDNAAALWEGLD